MNDFRDLLWEDYSFSSKELAVKQLSSADFDNRQLLRDTAREEAVQTVSFSAPGSLETLPEGAITETVSAVVFYGSSEKAVSTEYGRNISAESISGKNRSGAVQQEAEEKTITAAPQNTCSDTFKAAFDLTPTILSSGSADPGLLPAAATTAISLSGTDFTAEPEYSVFLLGEGDCSIIGTSDDGKYIVQGANSQYYVGTFYDAEKSTKTSDDNLCWAATASNMLTYTGWGLVNGMKNEDDLLDTFRPYFIEGYWTHKGLEWFFTGKYYDSNTGFYRENGGGGFYSNLTVADVQKNYVTSYFTNNLFPGNENVVASSQFASVLNQYLSQGYACGVSI